MINSAKILLTPHNIITIEDSQYDIAAMDLNAMFHIINSKCRLPDVDFWMPICFPSISADGYLNMYFRYISNTVGLVLLSSDDNNIGDAVLMCQKIEIVIISDPEPQGRKNNRNIREICITVTSSTK